MPCPGAGKGWYNLSERNYETYCFSKMKSLLAVTRFMMEDTLRSLVLDNHAKFVAFVAAVCSAKVCTFNPSSQKNCCYMTPDWHTKLRVMSCCFVSPTKG